MTQRQLACGLLALLLSLLSFAVVMQALCYETSGHRDGHRNARNKDRSNDRSADQRAAGGVIRVTLTAAQSPSAAPRETSPAPAAAAPASATATATATGVTANETTEATGASQPDDAGYPRTGNGAVAAYIPVAELSERPVLLQDIDALLDLGAVAMAGNAAPAAAQATAILLINEYGDVDRLQFESHAFPQYLESVLAERFAAARFLPGKIDGRPVRSALRIALQLH